MAQAQADVQAARNAAIVALAAQQLAALWPRVDWESPDAVNAVRTVYGAIVTRFGQATAAVAAEVYDDWRATKELRSQFRAAPADPVHQTVVDKAVRSAFLGAEPDDEHDPVTTSELPLEERVPARIDGGLQRLVLQPARDTIAQNSAEDPAKPVWIRVPKGAKTCAFCVLLASRELGPNFTGYQSRGNALFRKNGDKYHKKCDCEAIAVYPGDGIRDLSPNFDDFQDMYYKATADAGTHSDVKKILASMRSLYGLR